MASGQDPKSGKKIALPQIDKKYKNKMKQLVLENVDDADYENY